MNKIVVFNFLMNIVLICCHKIPRIGIIGGGIGGTSCAYFLKSLFGSKEIKIDLFEADKIGGRLSTVNFFQKTYEEGGSIIHSKNKYMTQFIEEFDLKKKHSTSGYFALYNGKNFVFSNNGWFLKNLWNVWYRYGFGVWKLKRHIKNMLNIFDRIYDLQIKGKTYKSVGALLAAMDQKFVEYLNVTSKSGFEKEGISDIIIDELVLATTHANYGQNVRIHEMVGSVSVAGAFGNLWSVKGGNVKIPECLLNASKANLILLPVTEVKKLSSGEMVISVKGGNAIKNDLHYDVVVLAAPQSSDSKHLIRFEGFEKAIRFLGRYHKTVCTLVAGDLSKTYFPTRKPSIDEILSIKEDLLFNSLGRVTPVDFEGENSEISNVWKIFTQKPLKHDELFAIFSNVSQKYVREWLAYPHYESRKSVENDSFVLASNLYYINAIEWVASAMEMSVIGAKNVALLVYENYINNDESLHSLRDAKMTLTFRNMEL